MRQTLLRIPLDGPWSFGPLGEVPGFGFGAALLLWVIVAVVWLWRFRKELRPGAEFIVPVVVWIVVAVLIVRAPILVHREAYQVIDATSAAIEAERATPVAFLARARAYQTIHRDAEAAADFRQAARNDARSVEAFRDLAWLLATSSETAVRNGEEAVKAAGRAVEMGGPDGWNLDVLSAALAESGQFDAAIAQARRAANLANETGELAVAVRLQGIRERLSRYQDHQPWREPRSSRGIPIYGYGFMLFLAFFAAGWTATRRAKSVGISSEVVWDVALWSFFAGVAGARLFYIVQYPDRVFGNRVGFEKLAAIFNLPDGGLVLYGGVLLGIVVYLLYCRRHGLKAERLADALVPSVFLGVAFGRMGCFLNGCCYGDRCELPWAVTFPVGSVPDMAMVTRGYLAADEVARRIALHPTQLYSVIDGLVLYALTASFFRRRGRDGSVTLVALFCYPVTRFLIEYLRSDEPPVLVRVRVWLFGGPELFQVQTPFTISQWVSVGLLAAAMGYLWWWLRRAPAAAAPVFSGPGAVASR